MGLQTTVFFLGHIAFCKKVSSALLFVAFTAVCQKQAPHDHSPHTAALGVRLSATGPGLHTRCLLWLEVQDSRTSPAGAVLPGSPCRRGGSPLPPRSSSVMLTLGFLPFALSPKSGSNLIIRMILGFPAPGLDGRALCCVCMGRDPPVFASLQVHLGAGRTPPRPTSRGSSVLLPPVSPALCSQAPAHLLGV